MLLVRHTDEGALGLILNRRTNALIQDAWDKVSDVPCHRDESIYLGGPCEGPLVALHTDEFLLETRSHAGPVLLRGQGKARTAGGQRTASRQSSLPTTRAGAPGNWRPRSPAADGR